MDPAIAAPTSFTLPSILLWIFTAISIPLAGLIGWAAMRGIEWIKLTVDGGRRDRALAMLDKACTDAVAGVEQARGRGLRGPTGALDPAAAAELRASAIDGAMLFLGGSGSAFMRDALGLDDAQLRRVVANRVEAAVYAMKTPPLVAPAIVVPPAPVVVTLPQLPPAPGPAAAGPTIVPPVGSTVPLLALVLACLLGGASTSACAADPIGGCAWPTSTGFENDFGGHVSLPSPDSVELKRQALVYAIWKGGGTPGKVPVVEQSVSERAWVGIPSLDRVDRLTTRMRYGVESSALLLRPKAPNGRILVFQWGHAPPGDGLEPDGRQHAIHFLDAGYLVYALDMPLMGRNRRPAGEHVVATLPSSGHRVPLIEHDDLGALDAPDFSPICYFVEPVLAGLNYLEWTEGFSSVDMTGISGGGWTTTLVAAIDPRVRVSVPVAGTIPEPLQRPTALFTPMGQSLEWEPPGDWEQDWERRNRPLYEAAHFLEQYAMGSTGKGRRQLQVMIERDPCCNFPRDRHPFIATYQSGLQSGLDCLGRGGRFDVFIDATITRHDYSPATLDAIDAALRVL